MQTTQTKTATTGTVTEDPVCTCCQPANTLIKNPQLSDEQMLCPYTGHIYEDPGDGVWTDTGKTLDQLVAERDRARPQGTTVIDREAGGDRPAAGAQTGTRVNLEDQAFS